MATTVVAPEKRIVEACTVAVAEEESACCRPLFNPLVRRPSARRGWCFRTRGEKKIRRKKEAWKENGKDQRNDLWRWDLAAKRANKGGSSNDARWRERASETWVIQKTWKRYRFAFYLRRDLAPLKGSPEIPKPCFPQLFSSSFTKQYRRNILGIGRFRP